MGASRETVSVILPTYNRAAFIDKAIGSVVAQGRRCDELIVVDDGSTDSTPQLLHRWSTVCPQLRVLRQGNRGAAAARNTGIRAACGQLLAFLDSDDQWHPDKLEVQLRAMQVNPAYGVSHTLETWYRHGRRVHQKKKHRPAHGDVFARSLAMCVIGMSTAIVRRQVFERYGLFDESLPCCEDYEFWLRVGVRERFLRVDQALTIKDGGRSDQLSNRYRVGMDVYRIRALQTLLQGEELNTGQRQLASRELLRKCRIYAGGCRKHGRPEEAAYYLRLAGQYQSWQENSSIEQEGVG
ncbi:MAG: glycosyl transferase family A [Desulfobulbus propionicus]|nr:MAG: glycosyl transferase family A [Desulfobulbus propionicus]